MTIALPALIAALAIGLLHWFPWHMLRGERLGRLTAYALGTGVIVGVSCVTFWVVGYDEAALILLAVACAAGLTTIVAYAYDTVVLRWHELRDLRDRTTFHDHTSAAE